MLENPQYTQPYTTSNSNQREKKPHMAVEMNSICLCVFYFFTPD